MKCTEARTLLAAYLSGEANESEITLIRLHLECCPACAAELAALRRAAERLHGHFRARLSQAQVPERTWKRINTTIGETNMNKNLPAPRPSGWRWALTGILVALVGVGVTVFTTVPPARAAVEEMLLRLIGRTDAGLPVLAASPFQPLYPAAIPKRIPCSASMEVLSDGAAAPETYLELRFFNQQEFVILYENPGQANAPLPEGEALEINGLPAVLLRNESGSVALMSDQPQPGRPPLGDSSGGGGGCTDDAVQPAPEHLEYTGANRLVWNQTGLRLELLSNLPYEEFLAIATSLKISQSEP